MTLVLAFLLVSTGTTLVVTRGAIFLPLRRRLRGPDPMAPRFFGVLLTCPMCFGFWSGAAWSLPFGTLARAWESVPPWLLPFGILAAGFASSQVGWVLHLVHRKLGEEDLVEPLALPRLVDRVLSRDELRSLPAAARHEVRQTFVVPPAPDAAHPRVDEDRLGAPAGGTPALG